MATEIAALAVNIEANGAPNVIAALGGINKAGTAAANSVVSLDTRTASYASTASKAQVATESGIRGFGRLERAVGVAALATAGLEGPLARVGEILLSLGAGGMGFIALGVAVGGSIIAFNQFQKATDTFGGHFGDLRKQLDAAIPAQNNLTVVTNDLREAQNALGRVSEEAALRKSVLRTVTLGLSEGTIVETKIDESAAATKAMLTNRIQVLTAARDREIAALHNATTNLAIENAQRTKLIGFTRLEVTERNALLVKIAGENAVRERQQQYQQMGLILSPKVAASIRAQAEAQERLNQATAAKEVSDALAQHHDEMQIQIDDAKLLLYAQNKGLDVQNRVRQMIAGNAAYQQVLNAANKAGVKNAEELAQAAYDQAAALEGLHQKLQQVIQLGPSIASAFSAAFTDLFNPNGDLPKRIDDLRYRLVSATGQAREGILRELGQLQSQVRSPLAAFAQAIEKGIGGILVTIGEAWIAAGVTTSVPLFSGPAAIAAGAALVAIGRALESSVDAQLSTVGVGDGGDGYAGTPSGSSRSSSLPTDYAHYTIGGPVTSRQSAYPSPAGPALQVVVIGPDDPTAQRQIMRLISNAQRRGL